MDLNENGFFVIENLFEKTINLKGRRKNNNENKRIEYNTKNKRKNKIITNISLINNNIITIKFLILIKINSHKLFSSLFFGRPFKFKLFTSKFSTS